jgi:hypothetical protein
MHIPSLPVPARAGIGIALAILVVTAPPSGAPGPANLAEPMLWLLVGGIVSGFMAGLLGIGGALVTVPAFYMAFPGLGVPPDVLPQSVVASSLLSMLPTTLAGIRCHVRHDTLDRRLLRAMAPRMMVGASLGALLALMLRGPVLALTFAAQGLYYGSRLLCGGARGGPPGRLTRLAAALPPWLVVPSISGFCACVGMGGGSMVVPYLMAQGLSLHRALATASALNLCIALGGSIVFLAVVMLSPASGRFVCWPAALAVGVLAVVMVPWGVALARRLPTARLGVLVGLVNVAGALSLVVQVAGAPSSHATRGDVPDAAAEVEAQWQQRALNALLVPLLDDGSPVNWAVPLAVTPCPGSSRISVDGGPVPHGAPIGDGPIVLRWKLADCWPLGFSAWGLDGEIEMTVVVGTDRLLAEVRPLGLTARTLHARYPLTRPFRAVLWLQSPPRPP